ncbi:hypothetical protein KSK55_05610 [Methanospirillum purgamenti]|uniref:Uncharacterized protein n=1 Tax=Methanospirillum hungatei TaxID=2203 RepID=A0A8F5VML8_METHU|nr:hypothetical protein [Methanospirillum hungatei]QXO95867.1 hypothetical protein KSK55_05610 [Methanospirillum hungatei]
MRTRKKYLIESRIGGVILFQAHISLLSALPLALFRDNMIRWIWRTRSCDVCDGKYVHYIERMTKERQKTRRKAFRMCRTCYARAQQREAAQCIALPGMIKTGNMRRWSVALGRCHLCDTGPIVWFDPVEHFGLCETCYARECSGVGGASERSERATSMG